MAQSHAWNDKVSSGPIGVDDRRRPYRLTAEGRAYLQRELSGLEDVVRTGLRRLRQT